MAQTCKSRGRLITLSTLLQDVWGNTALESALPNSTGERIHHTTTGRPTLSSNLSSDTHGAARPDLQSRFVKTAPFSQSHSPWCRAASYYQPSLCHPTHQPWGASAPLNFHSPQEIKSAMPEARVLQPRTVL